MLAKRNTLSPEQTPAMRGNQVILVSSLLEFRMRKIRTRGVATRRGKEKAKQPCSLKSWHGTG